MNVVLEHLKEIREFVFAAFYALFLNLSSRQPRRVVIYFHGINKANSVGFRRQMAYLAKNCFVVKPSKIKTAKANGTDNVVAITFDDAFTNIIENAVPVLKEHGFPAGIFVPVGNLGKPPRWSMRDGCLDKNEIIISKEQIEKLDRDGFEIFSHTLSHPALTEIEDNSLESELASSKHALEKIVGHEISGVSYPHGAYDTRVREAAQKAGYRLGFTIEPSIVDSATDCLEIGRVSVSPKDGLIKFRLKVSGAYQVVKYLRTLKKCLSLRRQ